MSNRHKIIRLFNEAKENTSTKKIPLAVVIPIALILTSALTFFISKMYFDKGLSVAEARASEAIAQVDALTKEIQKIKTVRLLADSLKIQNISIRKIDGELSVAGEIKNLGNRLIDDIEITLYCLKDGRPVYEKPFIASSSDGKPLKKYQRRKFRVKVDDAPENAEDVILIITDVEVK